MMVTRRAHARLASRRTSIDGSDPRPVSVATDSANCVAAVTASLYE
jgi:hypothetical protein